MSDSGHIYGVVLNDRDELERLKPEFGYKPYQAAPDAPVVYMKPRSSLARGLVEVKPRQKVTASSTLALLFSRDATRCSQETAMEHVGAVALALDLSYPKKDYYRPAVAQQNADGFLALGQWVSPRSVPKAIETKCGNAVCHNWKLDRLARDPARLITDLSAFMTLRAGDVLLVGLAGDAPLVDAANWLQISADGLPTLDVLLKEYAA